MDQAVEGNAPGRALELRNSVARPKKRARLMAWKNDRWPQGSASSPLGFILAPSQKAAGWSAFENWENVEIPRHAYGAPGAAKPRLDHFRGQGAHGRAPLQRFWVNLKS